MNDPTLALRDIHQVPAPAWWPPAPGWWVLGIALLLAVSAVLAWRIARARRQRAIARVFDEALAPVTIPAAQVACMSELLRRAARRHRPDADKLAGESWLMFLDADHPSAPFSRGDGRLLLEGGFRRESDVAQVEALRVLARERFIAWMK